MSFSLSEKIFNFIPNFNRAELESQFKSSLKRETFMHRILNSMNEAIVAIDSLGHVRFANESTYNLLGIKSTEALGQPLERCLKDADLLQKLISMDQDAHLTLEVKVKYPRALALTVQIIPMPKTDDISLDDNMCLLIFRDVSYEQIKYGNRERISQIETSRLLTAGIAHEIGNPLSAIILHTQLMERMLGNMPENESTVEVSRINNIINEESTRLKRIIADFLNAVRPLSIKLERGNLSQLLENVFELLYSELTEKNIAIIKSFDNDAETLFDTDQMRSVFINIIRNAMDAMPDGGNLVVKLERSSNWIKLSFKDDGVGIDAATQQRIFEPFYTTKNDGSGLGLLIVQRIISAHGGLISVNSSLGLGSEFLIELPIRMTTNKQPLPSPKN